MRQTILLFALAGSLLAAPAALAEAAPDPIQAALADTTRPQDDRDRDSARHPADMLAFAGVKPGDTVVDWIPGGGYFTRLFSNVVGDAGKVYAWVPKEIENAHDLGKEAAAVAAERKNVAAVIEPLLATTTPQNVDVVWTAQNYHDLYADFMGHPDVAAFNKEVFAMLKPGGVFIIVDHVANAGTGHDVCNTLHRIDPALVKAEVTAAGFVFEDESKVLANPEDTHELLVFDEKIRGKTDQFVYRFRKPAK